MLKISNQELIDLVKKLTKEGLTLGQIAKSLGCSKSNISKRCIRAGFFPSSVTKEPNIGRRNHILSSSNNLSDHLISTLGLKTLARKCGVTSSVLKQWIKYHNLPIPTNQELDTRRFLSYIDITEGCWLWTGLKYPNGYGRYAGGYAHRHAYELFIAPIPLLMDNKKACILHDPIICTSRSCVNPKHLRIGTYKDNALDRDIIGNLPNTKFSTNQIIYIRNNPNKLTIEDLSNHFKVSKKCISNILNRKTFKWI